MSTMKGNSSYCSSSIMSYRMVHKANSHESVISTTGVSRSGRRFFSMLVPSVRHERKH